MDSYGSQSTTSRVTSAKSWLSVTLLHHCSAKWNNFLFQVIILHCTATLGRVYPGLTWWILIWILIQVPDQLLNLLTCSLAHYHWSVFLFQVLKWHNKVAEIQIVVYTYICSCKSDQWVAWQERHNFSVSLISSSVGGLWRSSYPAGPDMDSNNHMDHWRSESVTVASWSKTLLQIFFPILKTFLMSRVLFHQSY